MPVEFPQFSGGGDPTDTLDEFVKQVHDFLAEIVRSDRDPISAEPLFEQELVPAMRAAWDEVKRAGLFDDVGMRIRDARPRPEATFGPHGLTGQQLRFKLAVIRFFHGRYIARGGRRLLKKLLDIIDDLLDSILEALGVEGAISEIKDFIKDSIAEEG